MLVFSIITSVFHSYAIYRNENIYERKSVKNKLKHDQIAYNYYVSSLIAGQELHH
jgi:hypothetical protein